MRSNRFPNILLLTVAVLLVINITVSLLNPVSAKGAETAYHQVYRINMSQPDEATTTLLNQMGNDGYTLVGTVSTSVGQQFLLIFKK
jgi:hypothetical protein